MDYVPFDLAKIIASYITEPEYKFHDWLPHNRNDWASRLQNNMFDKIESNVQRHKKKYKDIVDHMIKANENYWYYELTNKNKSIENVKKIIECLSSDLISGDFAQELYLYSYPDIKNNLMFAKLLSLNKNLRQIDNEATYAKIIRKAHEINI